MRRVNPAVWFVAPALALLVVFFLGPVGAAVLLSLTDFDIYAVAAPANLRFVGADNYVRLARAPLFWTALGNTFYFVLVAGPLSVGVALGAALLIVSRPRYQALFRTIFFVPVVTTLVAVAVVWRYVYHPRAGVLNAILAHCGIGPIDWLGDEAWAMPALILMAIWKNFGFNTVIFIAGLQSIPERLYEAARLDGATARQQLVHITLPMLAPTALFVVVVTLIGYFQLFAEPYVMTQGGPADRTLSVVLLMFQEGFRWWNLGYAAALAVVLFAIILGATFAAMRLGAREMGNAGAQPPTPGAGGAGR